MLKLKKIRLLLFVAVILNLSSCKDIEFDECIIDSADGGAWCVPTNGDPTYFKNYEELENYSLVSPDDKGKLLKRDSDMQRALKRCRANKSR